MESYFNYSLELIQKWGKQVFDYLPRILVALIVFLIFYIIATYVKKVSLRFYSRLFSKNPDIARFLSFAIYTILLFFGIFLALEILELEGVLTKLIAGAGIVGIIAGFAFKDIASNAFAGFLVNMQKPFAEGDWVTIDGNFGTVKQLGWITTTVETISGQEVFVPNQLIYNNSFINYSTFKKRRVILQSGVSYGDDLDTVKQVALEEIKSISQVLPNEEIDFFYTSIGSSAYNFEVRFWIRFQKQTDYLQAMSDAIMKVKKRFEQEDISIAYPVQTLDFGVKGGVNIFDKPIEIKRT